MKVKLKKDVKIKLVIVCAAVLVCIVCAFPGVRERTEKKEYNDNAVFKEEIPGMLEFTFFSKEEWEKELGQKLHDEIVEEDVRYILVKLNLTEYIDFEPEDSERKITREEWVRIYDQIIDLLDTESAVQKMDSIVLSKDSGENTVFTEQGNCVCEGVLTFFEPYETYSCYYYEGKLIGTAGKSAGQSVMENCYLKSASLESLSVLFREREIEIPVELTENLSAGVCDIVWEQGNVTEIRKKEEQITGNLLRIDTEKIEIEGMGVLERQEYLPVYQLYDDVLEKSLTDIVLGNMQVSYVMAGNRICAVLLTAPAEIKNVRVLLLGENGSGFRDEICLVSDVTFFAATKDGERTYAPGEIFKASEYGDEPVTLREEDGVSPFYFCNADGSRTSLGYPGKMEIRKYAEGYMIVNETGIENYLYSVVPSEMPSNYHLEALKAQAVCARSYVTRQLEHAAYPEYGAHLDDSTAFQVFNKQESSEEIRAAVDQTAGFVIKNQGVVAEAFYYSTSCGFSETDIVWNPADGITSDYLVCRELAETADITDISSEEAFRSFIDGPDATAYDSFSRYFRWSAVVSMQGKDAAIKEILTARKTVNPENIILEADGKEVSSADGFGMITGMNVTGRDTGGIITELDISFEKGIAKIFTEYNIRKVLSAGLQEITYQDGSVQTGAALLPSAYFYFDYDSEAAVYRLKGGGFGHGVGMSQNGAEGMAQKGVDFMGILNFYYHNIQIEGI